ncbi:hypothetical protein HPB50_008954 [Hyalomma asiaticum]|uniref:Uncharacterized protein n=1 Tax=Hyalomma asiaticum TaxID=266040 RepID=A0ACB7RZB5_HYAAI|nr:hypothetical protein HPB50_008954 [Hyalomma asiaticum]
MALSKERKKYLQVFLKQYTAEFGCVIASRKGEHHAFCTICKYDISISHGGRTDVVAHVSSKKHTNSVQCQEKQHRMQQFFGKQDGDNEVIRAECLFTDFLLEHSIPLSVSDHVGPLLRKMFPKCDVAKRYGCARTKTTMIVGEMASHAQECVVSALKRRVFAVATDGSNDRQAQLYPIVATFFAEESGLIESRLLTLSTLEGPSTGRNIAKLIMDSEGAGGAAVWQAEEQRLLEQALKTYPASTPDRWDRIAECVPTRSKKECMRRYKDLVELVKTKKAAQQAAAAAAQSGRK